MTLYGVLLRTAICCGTVGGIIAIPARDPILFIAPVVTGVAIAALAYTGWIPIITTVIIGGYWGASVLDNPRIKTLNENPGMVVSVAISLSVVFLYCLSFMEPRLWPAALSGLLPV